MKRFTIADLRAEIEEANQQLAAINSCNFFEVRDTCGGRELLLKEKRQGAVKTLRAVSYHDTPRVMSNKLSQELRFQMFTLRAKPVEAIITCRKDGKTIDKRKMAIQAFAEFAAGKFGDAEKAITWREMLECGESVEFKFNGHNFLVSTVNK